MAREMLSLGMFSALAAAMAERRRGLPSGSPPPAFAATMISLISRVKILPRLASSAPFLCLMVAHFEWPDMLETLCYLESSERRNGPQVAVFHASSSSAIVACGATEFAWGKAAT